MSSHEKLHTGLPNWPNNLVSGLIEPFAAFGPGMSIFYQMLL
jgi:hypothetical protein